MDAKEIEYLERFIPDNDIKEVLEFGSGGSTKFFLDRGCNIITIENEQTMYPSEDITGALSSKSYNLRYTNEEIIETGGENVSFSVFAQTVEFRDSASAKNFTEFILDALTDSELISKPESLSIEEFEGHSYVTHHVESRSETGHGLLIRKEDVIIYGGGNGLDRDTVVKVIGWLIDQT